MTAPKDELLVSIPADSLHLEGILEIPKRAGGIVIFVHGSGSSRHSPRNNFVAKALRDAGLGTLLFDLLTREEDFVYENRFNIPLLVKRLTAATKWVRKHPDAGKLRIGYFGASTGSAAALISSTEEGNDIGAIVSRGGRPDLAEKILGRIHVPTLLIVGGYDDIVIELNRRAYDLIRAEKELKVIPGATHLFEEPGKLDEVARLASGWFKRYL